MQAISITQHCSFPSSDTVDGVGYLLLIKPKSFCKECDGFIFMIHVFEYKTDSKTLQLICVGRLNSNKVIYKR